MKVTSLTFVVLLLLNVQASAVELNGTAKIIDGDTLVIQGNTVRLFGIDAAETGQQCVDNRRKSVRPSETTMARLESLIQGVVQCKGTQYDNYGRLIATCSSQASEEINRTLVKEGLAWAFVKYSDKYVNEEKEAQTMHIGVWQLACDPPWLFRERRWTVAMQRAPNGCPIKGNISANGKIYHTPWSRYYAQTGVNTKRGERWFCSEKEATDAGWRLPLH